MALAAITEAMMTEDEHIIVEAEDSKDYFRLLREHGRSITVRDAEIKDDPHSLKFGVIFHKMNASIWVRLGVRAVRYAPDSFKKAMRSDEGKQKFLESIFKE